jgi:hypothetical protein
VRLTCPICGSDIYYFRLTSSGKICYFNCYRCWLPPKHSFRMQKDSFRKATVIRKGPWTCLSRLEITENLSKLVLNEEENEYEGFGDEDSHVWNMRASMC